MKKKIILIKQMWEYTIKKLSLFKKKYKTLKYILDGNGLKRVEKLILTNYNKFQNNKHNKPKK